MEPKKHLLILGGGYGGTTLVHSLCGVKNLHVTLVNQNPFHIVQTEIHRFLGGATSEDDIYFDLEEFCKKNGAEFVCDKAIYVNEEEHYVELKSSKCMSFDYLVVATGAISFFPHQIQNIQEYSQDIKVEKDLRAFQTKFENLLTTDAKDKNIAIVGGGLTGTELALEYAAKVERLGIKEKCKISLIEQFPTLLPGCDASLIEETTKAVQKAGIKCYHDSFVSKIENDTIYLSNKEEIPFSLIILTIGVISETLKFKNDLPKSQREQFLVTPTLQLKENENIFAIGDVAYLEDDAGKMILPTAQNAKQQAQTVAKSIKKLLTKEKPLKYKYNHKGMLIDLAKSSAAGDAFGIKVHGKIAYILKRIVNVMHTRIFKK